MASSRRAGPSNRGRDATFTTRVQPRQRLAPPLGYVLQLRMPLPYFPADVQLPRSSFSFSVSPFPATLVRTDRLTHAAPQPAPRRLVQLVGYNVANMGENSVPSATPQLRVDCPRVDPLHDDSALTPSQTMRKCCDDFSPEEMTASMVAEGMRRAHAGTHTVNIDAQAPSPYSGDASALWSGGQPAGHTVPVAVPRHPGQGCLNPHIGLSESPASIGSGAGSIGSLSRGLSPLREDMKGMVL